MRLVKMSVLCRSLAFTPVASCRPHIAFKYSWFHYERRVITKDRSPGLGPALAWSQQQAHAFRFLQTHVCKDAKLMGDSLRIGDIDVIFSKVKTKGERKISFEQFVYALGLVAESRVGPARDQALLT